MRDHYYCNSPDVYLTNMGMEWTTGDDVYAKEIGQTVVKGSM